MSERLLAAFAGTVTHRIAPVTRSLVLSGRDRDSGGPLQVSFNAGQCAFDAVMLSDLQVFEPEPPRGEWIVQQGQRRWTVRARAAQMHLDVSDRFHAAVPGAPLTVASRAGWFVLLSLLRLPGAGRLLQWLRSR